MMFYQVTFLLTELLMLTMLMHVVGYSGFTWEQKSWHMATFLSIAFCSAAEYAVHGVTYRPAYAVPLTALTVLQFTAVPMLGLLFSGALGIHHRGRLVAAFFALNLVVEATAACFGYVFYFNDEGYFRGSGFWIYGLFNALSVIYLFRNLFVVGRRFRHQDARTITMVMIILLSGVIPMALLRLNIAYMAISLSATVCYIYYNDLVQQNIKEDLVDNQKRLYDMQTQIVSGMANLIENRDLETGQHITRTGRYVKLLSEYSRAEGVYVDRLDDRFISLMTMMAPLHDIGKILVPDSILQKPGKLTPEEFEVMKQHAAQGGKVVREIMEGIADEESVAFAADIATYHHERWNGTGYPEGRKGEDIPLSARIMAIADVFDALISERCYKKAYPVSEAIEIIRSEAGHHFDPQLVRVFLTHKDAFLN